MRTHEEIAELQLYWERRQLALALRQGGATYAEIGKLFGVTPHRARQLVIKAEQEERWGVLAPVERWKPSHRDWLVLSRKAAALLRKECIEVRNG